MTSEDPKFFTSTQSDAELWAGLQAGDMRSLGEIYDRYASLVYTIALKATKNTQDAEDLTQTIFLRLATTNYDPKRGSMKTFLAILTRSRSLDLLRSRQRSYHRLNKLGPQLNVQSETVDVPVEAFDHDIRTQEVQTALENLSENQREVLNLAYGEGLSQSAIAEHLAVPLGTVKAWARRGLLKLRQNLTNSLSEDM